MGEILVNNISILCHFATNIFYEVRKVKNLSKFFSIVCVMIFGLCFKQVVRAEFELGWHAKITAKAFALVDKSDWCQSFKQYLTFQEEELINMFKENIVNLDREMNCRSADINFRDAGNYWLSGKIFNSKRIFLKYLFFKQKRFYGGVSDDAAVEATINEINGFISWISQNEL